MHPLRIVLPCFLLLAGCSGRTDDTSLPERVVGQLPIISADNTVTIDTLSPYLGALQGEIIWREGGAWRVFPGDTIQYKILADTVYKLNGGREVVVFRCIAGDEPCSHAQAALFQIVQYQVTGDDASVIRQSKLLPVYSPWCDQLAPQLIRLKGIPHLLFEMHDSHQGNAHSEYWMISAGERNFGKLVWHEDVYTATYSMGDSDSLGFFEEEEMEASIEFDTTRCDQGKWVMNISKTITKRLSNIYGEESVPESKDGVRNTPPVVKTNRVRKAYVMNAAGRLVQKNQAPY